MSDADRLIDCLDLDNWDVLIRVVYDALLEEGRDFEAEVFEWLIESGAKPEWYDDGRKEIVFGNSDSGPWKTPIPYSYFHEILTHEKRYSRYCPEEVRKFIGACRNLGIPDRKAVTT